MRKTFTDNCDINIVQRTCCEPLFADVQMQLKMYFFVPFVRPCIYHNYGVISRSHACRDCGWHIILDVELYTTCLGEQVLVATRFNVTFLPLRLCYEKTRTCFSKESESLITYGYTCLDAVRLFVFVPILWTLQWHFTLWLSARTLQCVFDWWQVMSKCIRILPGLDQLGIGALLRSSEVTSITC